MSRWVTILLGSLLLVWQLGCGSLAPPSTSQPPTNISISPSSAVMGSPDLTVTIVASQRFSFSHAGLLTQVMWFANGSDTRLETTVLSGSRVTAIVPATLLVSPVDAKVRVEIWNPRQDFPHATSSIVPFRVTSASAGSPLITSISPEGVRAGSPEVTMIIRGSNFSGGDFRHSSVAFWTTCPNLHDCGTMLNTTPVSNSELTAVIPAALLESPVSVQIIVLKGDPMGMSDGFFGYPSSNSVAFSVTP